MTPVKSVKTVFMIGFIEIYIAVVVHTAGVGSIRKAFSVRNYVSERDRVAVRDPVDEQNENNSTTSGHENGF